MKNIFSDFLSNYDGETVAGNSKNGEGEFRFINVDSCKGGWIEGGESGECTYVFSDGGIFKGTFSNGLPNDLCEYTSHEGNVLTGTYINGLMEGEGTWFVFRSSDIYVNDKGTVRDDSNVPQGFEKDFWKPIIQGKRYRIFCREGVIMRAEEILPEKVSD